MSERPPVASRIRSKPRFRAVAPWLLAAPLAGATIPVGTTVDDFTANGNCTLREALFAAQLDVAFDACAAGDSTVTDLVTLAGATYRLDLGQLQVADGDVIVRGRDPVPDGPSDVAGIGASRLLDVSGGASVVLERLRLLEGDAGTTATDFGGAVRAIDVRLELVDVVVSGNSAAKGGGVYFQASESDHELVVRRSRFEQNRAASTVSSVPAGGGLYVSLASGARATILDSTFEENRVDTTAGGGTARGAALYAVASGSTAGSELVVRRSRFVGNVLACAPVSQGDAAVSVQSNAGSSSTLVDVIFEGNDAQPGCHNDSTTALRLSAFGGHVTLDRARLLDEDEGESRHHLQVSLVANGTLRATNLLLARGPADGFDLTSSGSAAQIGHLTVFGHANRSASVRHLDEAATTVLDNSIFWGNGTDAPFVAGGPQLRSNLIGVDPLFVDAPGGDFGLAPGSPAIGAGDRALSTVHFADAAHAPRIFGAQTDAGAYERRGIWADDFELGDADDWSLVAP